MRAETAVKNSFANDEAEARRKRQQFDELDAKMKQHLAELKDKDTVVEINPDKHENTQAEDGIKLIEKVAKFLDEQHYEAAETLLRYIYRITPIPAARTALSSARRLCHVAVKAENKWVRRRATLLRRKEDSATIRGERKKYIQDRRHEIGDFLTTALLEIGEGIEKRSGDYYAKLPSTFEVRLPNLHGDEEFVLAKAPVMFNSKKYLDERRFKQVMQSVHGIDPGLKRIERGFFVCRNISLVGIATPIESEDGNKQRREKQIRKLERAMEAQLKRGVSVVGFSLAHRSSKLFWYAFDFPVEVEMMQFADIQIAEDYGSQNTALLQLDNGKMSRDDFVKLREEARKRGVALKSMRLRELREEFKATYAKAFREIEDLRDVSDELSEKMAEIKRQFNLLTSISVDDENKGDGLAISQYKRLYQHTARMYTSLAEVDTAQRDRLHRQLFENRMEARYLYYVYREMAARRSEFGERIGYLSAVLADKRNIMRGTGKSLTILDEKISPP